MSHADVNCQIELNLNYNCVKRKIEEKTQNRPTDNFCTTLQKKKNQEYSDSYNINFEFERSKKPGNSKQIAKRTTI